MGVFVKQTIYSGRAGSAGLCVVGIVFCILDSIMSDESDVVESDGAEEEHADIRSHSDTCSTLVWSSVSSTQSTASSEDDHTTHPLYGLLETFLTITPDLPESSWLWPAERHYKKLQRTLLSHARQDGDCFLVRPFPMSMSIKIRGRRKVLRISLLNLVYALQNPMFDLTNSLTNTCTKKKPGELCINCAHIRVCRLSLGDPICGMSAYIESNWNSGTPHRRHKVGGTPSGTSCICNESAIQNAAYLLNRISENDLVDYMEKITIDGGSAHELLRRLLQGVHL